MSVMTHGGRNWDRVNGGSWPYLRLAGYRFIVLQQ
jgi:hypothetical protein